MRTFVKLLFLFLVCASALAGKGPPMILGGPVSRSVCVETDHSHGTGIIIANGLVLTNRHVLVKYKDKDTPWGSLILNMYSYVKVDGKDACLVAFDTKRDLALLQAETPSVPPLYLTGAVAQDDEIVVVGNPLHHRRMISRGRIVDIDEETGTLYIDAHIFLGSSGSGVYNDKGALVGIVEAIEGGEGDGFPFGVVIPAKDIVRFLLRAGAH